MRSKPEIRTSHIVFSLAVVVALLYLVTGIVIDTAVGPVAETASALLDATVGLIVAGAWYLVLAIAGVYMLFIVQRIVWAIKPYPITTFGIHKRVETTAVESVDECCSCEVTDVEGERRTFYQERVIAGVRIPDLGDDVSGVNEYCGPCATDPIEAALRAENGPDASENGDTSEVSA